MTQHPGNHINSSEVNNDSEKLITFLHVQRCYLNRTGLDFCAVSQFPTVFPWRCPYLSLRSLLVSFFLVSFCYYWLHAIYLHATKLQKKQINKKNHLVPDLSWGQLSKYLFQYLFHFQTKQTAIVDDNCRKKVIGANLPSIQDLLLTDEPSEIFNCFSVTQMKLVEVLSVNIFGWQFCNM